MSTIRNLNRDNWMEIIIYLELKDIFNLKEVLPESLSFVKIHDDDFWKQLLVKRMSLVTFKPVEMSWLGLIGDIESTFLKYTHVRVRLNSKKCHVWKTGNDMSTIHIGLNINPNKSNVYIITNKKLCYIAHVHMLYFNLERHVKFTEIDEIFITDKKLPFKIKNGTRVKPKHVSLLRNLT